MPGVPPTRFAYLGPEGTFAEAALRTIPAAAEVTALPQPTVHAALEAVRAGDADAAVVPLENSVEGSVASTLDELATGEPLVITREVLLPVTFALMVRPGTTAAAVKTVATHPHAEAQCRRWLREQLPRRRGRAHRVDRRAAAVAVAAGEYDAAVGRADRRHPQPAGRAGRATSPTTPGAVTRFVLRGEAGPAAAPTGADKTSLVAFIRHDHTGALLEVLTEFAVRGVNLTRIESRPTGERLGRYCFSIDCEGHVADARVGEALAGLRRICADVRFLGSYPRGGPGEPPRLPPGRDDAAFADAAAWLGRLRRGE